VLGIVEDRHVLAHVKLGRVRAGRALDLIRLSAHRVPARPRAHGHEVPGPVRDEVPKREDRCGDGPPQHNTDHRVEHAVAFRPVWFIGHNDPWGAACARCTRRCISCRPGSEQPRAEQAIRRLGELARERSICTKP
jgi:hypothetical protein